MLSVWSQWIKCIVVVVMASAKISWERNMLIDGGFMRAGGKLLAVIFSLSRSAV